MRVFRSFAGTSGSNPPAVPAAGTGFVPAAACAAAPAGSISAPAPLPSSPRKAFRLKPVPVAAGLPVRKLESF